MNDQYKVFLFTEFQYVDARGELFANELDGASIMSTLRNKVKDRGFVNILLTNHHKSTASGFACALIYSLIEEGVDLSEVEFISDSAEIVRYVGALTDVASRVGSLMEAEQVRLMSEKRANKQVVEPSDVLSPELAAEFTQTFGSNKIDDREEPMEEKSDGED